MLYIIRLDVRFQRYNKWKGIKRTDGQTPFPSFYKLACFQPSQLSARTQNPTEEPWKVHRTSICFVKSSRKRPEAKRLICGLWSGSWGLITGPVVCARCLMPSGYVAQQPNSLFLRSFMLFLCFVSVCHFCPSAFKFALPEHPSFILHLFVAICLPASRRLRLLHAPPPPGFFPFTQNPPFTDSPLLYSSVWTVCFPSVLQWSYGFYLTHNQGQSGFEFFFKTKELKKKWLEQFGMAMWVFAFSCVCVSACAWACSCAPAW